MLNNFQITEIFHNLKTKKSRTPLNRKKENSFRVLGIKEPVYWTRFELCLLCNHGITLCRCYPLLAKVKDILNNSLL